MIALKSTIRLRGLYAQIVLAIIIAKEIFQEFGFDCIITSVNDSIHKPGSRHYDGKAVDIRTSHITDLTVVQKIEYKLCQRLNSSDYDVLFEGDHIHIEYDPK